MLPFLDAMGCNVEFRAMNAVARVGLRIDPRNVKMRICCNNKSLAIANEQCPERGRLGGRAWVCDADNAQCRR